ncbi:MAG: pyridoxal-phosphate dependent enzyme [bacterium]
MWTPDSHLTPALFERYPQLVDRVPWTPLGSYPTPVSRLSHLTRELGSVEIWAKRDDRAGALYGGNKVRKLEFVLADAQEREARRVWTIGGVGSHQVLATAIYARSLAISSAAVVFPQPRTDHVRQVLHAIVETGCDLQPARHMLTVPVASARLVARLTAGDGGVPYLVPPGASSALGALGYVSAALELAGQIRDGECPQPEAIFTPLGSMGTAAGLLVGLRLAGLSIPVHCVRVVAAPLAPPSRLAALCRDTAALLRRHGVQVPGTFRSSELLVEHGYVGRGYGYPTAAGRAALAAAAADDIDLETTYTGKAMAGLMAHVVGRRPGWRRVLFWNTFSSVSLTPRTDLAQARARLPEPIRSFLSDV